MTDTPNLSLPYIAPSQAQKHVTHNEALRTLDAVVQLSVVDRGGNLPPENPAEGQRHLVGSAPTGLWQGQGDSLAAFQDGAWVFLRPRIGWVAWVVSENAWISFNGSEWMVLMSGNGEAVSRLGVNTIASGASRFAVKSDGVSFSHDDVTPGNGDLRHYLNKADPSRTVSQVFQSGWSGRAETGLTGDDDFRIKVSADGSIWRDALLIDRQSAVVRLPSTPMAIMNLLEDGGRFAGSPEAASAGCGAYVAPAYVSGFNGSTIVAGPKRIHGTSSYGGTGAATDPLVMELIERLKSTTGARCYGHEWYAMDVTMGPGTASGIVIAGQSYFAPIIWSSAQLPEVRSLNFHFRVLSGAVMVNSSAGGDSPYVDGSPLAAPQVFGPSDGWRQVTRLRDDQSSVSVGYDQRIDQIYSQSGSRFLIALPLLFPGHLPMAPGKLFGLAPSYRARR